MGFARFPSERVSRVPGVLVEHPKHYDTPTGAKKATDQAVFRNVAGQKGPKTYPCDLRHTT